MAKRRLTIRIELPPYRSPRNNWRKIIHMKVLDVKRIKNIEYKPTDKLEVHVVLNLSAKESLHHDVDNRLKDIMDALQGRAGGPKSIRQLSAIVPNDSQIYRVSVEKSPRPDNKRPHGSIIIRKLQRKR